MKNTILYIAIIICTGILTSCDKRYKDVVTPDKPENRPQIILLNDEGDGNVEDDDKMSIVLKLSDRIDPSGEELEGKIIPLSKEVRINFSISDIKGFTAISDYLLDWKAFYEIDDCTTSEDEGIDLNMEFDPATGKGTVLFPAGVEEIELEFELKDDLFDDAVINTEDRGFKFALSGVENSNGQNVVVNTSQKFEYEVLDDEVIIGEWELDHNNTTEFENFKKLFGLINEAIAQLQASDVEEIAIEFEYDKMTALVVLKETEEIEECGETETVNKEIEIEAEYEEINKSSLSGEIEVAEEIEQRDNSVLEFSYKGNFEITANELVLTLNGGYDDNETGETSIHLSR